MATLHIIVRGKVQGVFFRATAKKVAEELGITGKIRNTEEGNVEVWASGSQQQVDKFLVWCRRGPSGAKVDAVDAKDAGNQAYEGFMIDRE